ncbi:NtaA/DmoA family FMN-dependent monooxygenase, partial [Nocardia farcinica]|uniref:NtaA/DmoA family FMN-dependent monooxygenase n=1 Tax=Nocardia farcinica TaxID=37329 RepID=UPI002454E76A
MTRPRKQVHLAAHFPGVNNTTVWSDPDSGSQIDFASFEHLARTAERGLFDFFFLAEGLRLREHRGRIHDLDVVGRPDTFTVLNALAGVTERLGLAGTINSTYNEPFELAKQFASLDHLSGGRAAWNVVTSSDAFTGENFRRGGYLEHADRYRRAAEVVELSRALWDSWPADALVVDRAAGVFARAIPETRYRGSQFDIAAPFVLPPSPQGHPVLLQAGDSDEGREFGAAAADAIFTAHGTPAAGRAFYADVKGRLTKYGRRPEHLKIFPAATFVGGGPPPGGPGRGPPHPGPPGGGGAPRAGGGHGWGGGPGA